MLEELPDTPKMTMCSASSPVMRAYDFDRKFYLVNVGTCLPGGAKGCMGLFPPHGSIGLYPN